MEEQTENKLTSTNQNPQFSSPPIQLHLHYVMPVCLPVEGSLLQTCLGDVIRDSSSLRTGGGITTTTKMKWLPSVASFLFFVSRFSTSSSSIHHNIKNQPHMVRFFLTGTTAIATFIIRLVLLGLVHNITTTRAFSSILVHYPSIATTTTTTTTHLKMSSSGVLNRVTPDKVALEIKDPVDPTALGQAKAILEELTANNHQPNGSVHGPALLKVAQRLGDLSDTAIEFVVSKQACQEAYESLTDTERTALTNIYQRIKRFAEFQRQSVVDMEMDIPGGKAGHTVSPCRAAGCYAPGGRYPLPSSVLMTAVTARAAGCQTVVLASPRPAPITMAAAHIANVDVFLCVGGAQAIGSMAYGIDGLVPRCDVICGPGNKWVTAAKSIVNGKCGIDMLAGPSEVLVICDETANAKVVAADLIAQAEHDVVARAILLCTDNAMIEAVDQQVGIQIEALPEPNRSTALEALKQSFAVKCESIEECITISDDIAPEHLEIQTKDSQAVGTKCTNYGGLFVGEHAAEVLGDYGAGPNHTLPTGGTGRYTGGLSVFNFLRIRTWMRVDDATASQGMVNDSVVMARLEGLEGHARAAEARKQ